MRRNSWESSVCYDDEHRLSHYHTISSELAMYRIKKYITLNDYTDSLGENDEFKFTY